MAGSTTTKMVSGTDIGERLAVSGFLRSRSEDDFERLFEALYGRLLAYFMVRGVAQFTAEDLTQDVLLTVYRRIGSLRDKEQFFGWLFKIAHNEYLQWLRDRKHAIATVELEAGGHVSLANVEPDSLAAHDQFLKWMALLEIQERQIMMLRCIEELGYQEIADALEMPIGTVKWKIFNAREKIAAALSPRKLPEGSLSPATRKIGGAGHRGGCAAGPTTEDNGLPDRFVRGTRIP